VNTCAGGNEVEWLGDVNLSVLGNITDDEVIIGENFVYVDTVARPDLDVPARLTFKQLQYAAEPDVLKDDIECGDCVVTYSPLTGTLEVLVMGFSNYSLQGRQDFIVYSDTAPELKQKVYQTIDLGDANRDVAHACVVQVFGQSVENPGQWILVQTNPEREVQGRLFGDVDPNQPESLGYFPTVNGMANTYFRNDNLYGYMDFEMVIQCSSANASMLIYEESISTRYSPLGRRSVARGVWLSDGENAFYLVIYAVVVLLGAFLVVGVWRRLFR
jgi:hypothetical protein